MSTEVKQSSASLDTTQRDWLKKMGAILNIGVADRSFTDAILPEQDAAIPTPVNEFFGAGNDGTNAGSGLAGGTSPPRVVAQSGEPIYLSTTDQSTYEERLPEINGKLLTILKENPSDDKLKPILTRMKTFDEQMRLYASRHDWAPANAFADRLLKEIEEYEKVRDAPKQSAAKDEYIAKRYKNSQESDKEFQLAIASTPADRVSKELYDKLKKAHADMEAAVEKYNYVAALKHFNNRTDLLAKYKQEPMRVARTAFEDHWNYIKAGYLQVIQQKPAAPTLQKIHEKMTKLDAQMKDSLRKGDYITARNQLNQLTMLLQEYRAADTNRKPLKEQFESEFGKFMPLLDIALSADWHNEEMIALQDGLKKKNEELKTAVSQKDYQPALVLFKELKSLVETFNRTTPLPMDKIALLIQQCQLLIEKKYTRAEIQINDSVKAYKDALAEFQKATKKVDFPTDFLIALFLAGIGGAAGGAVAVYVKDLLEHVKEKVTKVGAVIDASKYVVKFLIRDLGSKVATAAVKDIGAAIKTKDPLAGLSLVGGGGVELGESVAKRIREEKIALLETLLVFNKEAFTTYKKEILVEGEPDQAIVQDAFLNALDKLMPSQKAYAEKIWLEWAETHSDEEVFLFWKDIVDQAGTIESLKRRYDSGLEKVQKELGNPK